MKYYIFDGFLQDLIYGVFVGKFVVNKVFVNVVYVNFVNGEEIYFIRVIYGFFFDYKVNGKVGYGLNFVLCCFYFKDFWMIIIC